MDIDLFKLILDRCEEAKIPRIALFTTGESLLHPKFLEMLWLAAGRPGIRKIAVSTNGSLLDENHMREILNTKKGEVCYSFSGWNKESYETRYIGGVFEEAVKRIKLFNQLVQRAGLPPETLRVYGVVGDDEAREKTFNFLKNTVGLNPCQIDLKYPFNWIDSILGAHGCGDKERSDEHKSKRVFCSVINSQLGVLYDGRVTACGCLDINGELIIGDIREQSIRAIKEGEKFRKLVRRFNQGDLKGLICYECNNKTHLY